MSQFDTYRNPGKRTGRAYPYSCRFIIESVGRDALPLVEVAQSVLTPIFYIDGRDVFLNPFDVTPMPLDRLVHAAASLDGADEAKRRIQKALDEVLSPY